MKQKNSEFSDCYNKYPPLRKEIIVLILLSIILIPLVVIIFTQLQPNVEKVYRCEVNETFTIDSFNVSYYDTSINNVSEIFLTQSDFGEKFVIEYISFGFNDFTDNYTTQQYEQSYIFQSSDSDYLNRLIKYGRYAYRLFSTENYNSIDQFRDFAISFKYPPQFNLFYVEIHIKGIDIPFSQSFYRFFEHRYSDTQINEVQLTLYKLQFNSTLYSVSQTEHLTPYTIFNTIFYQSYSKDLFNFAFR